MIERVHHVQITIPFNQEEKGREFYCRILGFREIEKPEALRVRGGFWLELGDFQIHVGTEDSFDRLHTKAHLAYQVSDLEEWKSRLSFAGCEILDGIPIPGMVRFETRDPFGNRLEFLQLTD